MSNRHPYIYAHILRPWLVSLVAMLFVSLRATVPEAHAGALTEAQWKANLIVHCATQFKWPESRASESRFLVGIMGNEEVRELVERMLAGKKIGGKPTHVIDASATEVPNCHVVYAANPRAHSALTQAKGNAVVTIGEKPDGAIVWFTSNGAVAARGNRGAMEKAGLSCSATMAAVLFPK